MVVVVIMAMMMMTTTCTTRMKVIRVQIAVTERHKRTSFYIALNEPSPFAPYR